jgi:glycosyltransferase involved in cell wall biosynthesis
MKISLFVHSLDGNPIVRAKPIADALVTMGYEVEVLGLLIDSDRVYEPYRLAFDYITLRLGSSIWDLRKKAYQLANLATGDVAYAFKPLTTSFWPALIYSDYGRSRPILLDVEDDDVISFGFSGLRSFARLAMKGWNKPTDYKFNIWLHRFVRRCSLVTVSSRKLSSYYGGNIVLHGSGAPKDIVPVGSEQQMKLRQHFGIPENRIALLFAGVDRPHKGVDLLLAASELPVFSKHFHLVLAGDPGQSIFRQAKKLTNGNCTVLGTICSNEISSVVQACDIVPVLQENNPYTESQIPGKLLEALGCSRPVIATDVGDLKLLLEEGPLPPRGWIMTDRTLKSLEKLLLDISKKQVCLHEIRSKGAVAKEYYRQNCSPEAIAGRLANTPFFQENANPALKVTDTL